MQGVCNENSKESTDNDVRNVPFSVVTDLFKELRVIRSRKRSAGPRNRDGKDGSTKRELMLRVWLHIAEKLSYSRERLANWKSEHEIVPAHLLPPDEAFKIVSIVVPDLDCAHSYIGMKESKLADAFTKVLDLVPRSENAEWLKNFRDKQYRPDRWKLSTEIVDGSFPSVLRAVLHGRCPLVSTLTIGDVWDALGELSEVSNVQYHRIQRPNYQAPRTAGASFPKISKGDMGKRMDALRKILKAGTPDDVAEFCRIVLKNTEINVSHDWFLNWFHPGAKQHYNQTHDIYKLLKDCHDPGFKIGEVTVQVGRYASVMLTQRPSRKNLKVICERLCSKGDGKGAETAEAAERNASMSSQFLGMKEDSPRYFLIEPKLDGERMQLHMAREYDENGRCSVVTVQTFSRRGMSSSDMYASAMREVISESVVADAIILDGEIMIWDMLRESWLAFSRFRDVATKIAQGNVEEGSSYMMKFMVFDVLYVDQSKRKKSSADSTQAPHKVVRLPLYLRRMLLDKVIRPAVIDNAPGIKSSVEVVEATRGRGEEQLLTAMQKMCSEGLEGVIAKNPDRPYALADRSADVAIKLKPDYFDGGLQDIDVLILGARFSTSVSRAERTGDLSTFLIGVRDDKYSESLNDDMWVPVGAVGTGYSDEDLKRIRDALDGHWHDFDSKNLPAHITPRKYSSSIFKDLTKWIAPKNSLVLTIRAYELNMNYVALRFPRVEQINWTKPCFDVITVTELIEQNEGKTPAYVRADEHDADDVDARSGSSGMPNKRKKTVLDEAEATAIARAQAEGVRITGGSSAKKIISSAKGANVLDVAVISDAFKGCTFHVIGSDEGTEETEQAKEAIEVKIHELGGKFVQNLTSKVDYVVGIDGSGLAKILDKFEGKPDDNSVRPVVKPSWVYRSRAEKRKVNMEWRDVLFAPAEVEEELLKHADRFGDPWNAESTPKGVLETIERIANVSVKHEGLVKKRMRESMKVCTDERAITEIGQALSRSGAPLRDRSFYVPEGLSFDVSGATFIVRALGGNIVQDFEDGVSVLVHERCQDEWQKMKQQRCENLQKSEVVTNDWVKRCLDNIESGL